MNTIAKIRFAGRERLKAFPPKAAGRFRSSTIPALQFLLILLAVCSAQAVIVWNDDENCGLQVRNSAGESGKVFVDLYVINDTGLDIEQLDIYTQNILDTFYRKTQQYGTFSGTKAEFLTLLGDLCGIGVDSQVVHGWSTSANTDGTVEWVHSGRGWDVFNVDRMAMTTFGIPWQLTDWNRDGIFNAADGDGLALTNADSYVAAEAWNQVSSRYIWAEHIPTAAVPETTNGTPMFWLNDYGLTNDTADVDNDGFQTLEEYIAGTDPTNAASYFQIDISADGIQIPTISNRVYSICRAGTVADLPAAWDSATKLPGIGNTLTIPFDTNRFYRVEVQLP